MCTDTGNAPRKRQGTEKAGLNSEWFLLLFFPIPAHPRQKAFPAWMKGIKTDEAKKLGLVFIPSIQANSLLFSLILADL